MDDVQDYFLGDDCANKDFQLVFNFSLRFHGVNFSHDLIYDELIDERYQCTKCKKIFTKNQIEEGLSVIKKSRKRS